MYLPSSASKLNYFRSSASYQTSQSTSKMLSRAAVRASSTTSMVAHRSFHSTRVQLSSPYHYPEGPRNNLPFNPLTKWFAVRYWLFMFTGFSLPFGVAVWQTKKNK